MTLSRSEAEKKVQGLGAWKLAADARIIRAEYVMEGFTAAVELIAAVAELADRRDHHPDVHLVAYRKLSFELSTHSEGGLTEKDFALASEIEALPKKLKK